MRFAILASAILLAKSGLGQRTLSAPHDFSIGTSVKSIAPPPASALANLDALWSEDVVTDRPIEWARPLGKYKPMTVMTGHDVFLNEAQYLGYSEGVATFVQALKDAQGKSDPNSRRLQKFQEMLDTVKQINDPLVQAYAIYEYTLNAVKYVDRGGTNPKNMGKDGPNAKNIGIFEHHVFTPQKAIGGGEGMCAEQGLTMVLAIKMLDSPSLQAWAIGGHHSNGMGHLVVQTLIRNKTPVTFDPANKIVEKSDNFFSGLWTQEMIPEDVLNAEGHVIALFESQQSKDIVIEDNKDNVKLPLLGNDKKAYDKAVQIGHEARAVKGKTQGNLGAELPRPSSVEGASGPVGTK